MAEKSVSKELQSYLDVIATYEREYESWKTRAKKIVDRYRDQDKGRTSDKNRPAKFNILWSNVQTLIPAVYARVPKPDVSRRFSDNDPMGRIASQIIERGLEFEMTHYQDFKECMRLAVTDRFLGGRGTAWIRYEPHTIAQQSGEPDDGLLVSSVAEDPEDSLTEEIEYECAPIDYVNWNDFGHSIARTWDEVTSVWRVVYMSKASLEERFGKSVARQIPLDAKEEDMFKNSTKSDYAFERAKIYEVWDREKEKVIWFAKSSKDLIDEREDPLELEGFFPCPKPLYATVTSESLIPVPDFALYQDQARELDLISDRIDGLVKALKVTGVYDASVPALKRLFTEAANTGLIPVSNWLAFAEKNGLKGAIDIVDLMPIANTLTQLYQARHEVQSQIYEITGISDIIRGQTDAGETATAQQIKGQYANLRLKALQDEVAQFATEIIQLKAQVMCKHFQPQTLIAMSAADQMTISDGDVMAIGQVPPEMIKQMPPDQKKQMVLQAAIQLLKQDVLSDFRIAIAADSLVNIDEKQEKQDRVEYLTAMGGFIAQALPVVQGAPQLAPLVAELIKFGTTAFKAAKPIEGQVDAILDQLEQQAQQPKPPPPPDPELIKVQEKAKLENQVAQQQHQRETMKMQAEQQLSEKELAMKNQIEMQKIAQQREIEAQKLNDHKEIEGQRIASSERPAMAVQLDAKGALEQVAGTLKDMHTDQATRMEQASMQMEKTAEVMAEAAKAIAQAATLMSRPKRIIRGADGRAAGVETVQ